MSGWYRRFIPKFASVTAPITELLKKGTKKFLWNEEADKALAELKICLTSAPVLKNPDYEREFTIQCDASDTGVGAILTQSVDDKEHVIAYMSQKLTATQQKYTVTEKECLAVILAVEKFRGYVEGVKFVVITDHSSLLWLKTMQNPSGRLWRWMMRLQAFNFDIVHRKGSKNVVPDALSRAVVESFVLTDGKDIDDEWYEDLFKQVKENPKKHADFKISENSLYKHCKSRKRYGVRKSKWKLVVPQNKRQELYEKLHDNPTAGHLGYSKTLNRIASSFYWPRMSDDIKSYVNRCEACKASKPATARNKAPLGKPKEAQNPWEWISIDFLGPYPRSKDGNTTILVICDWFSKFVIAKAIRTADAKTLTKILERDVFLTFGVPKVLCSDNGKQIVSNMMKELLAKYQIKHFRTPYYAPQANNAERVNKVLTSCIRTYLKNDQREWDKQLPKIVTAINTAVHESTKFTPYFVNFGKEMCLSGQNLLGMVGDDQDKRSSDWQIELEKVREEVRKNLTNAYNKEKKYYDMGTKEVDLKIGDILWRRNFQLSDASNTISAKLLPKYIKCTIKSGKSPVYEVEDVETKKVGTYHVKDLYIK